jgi:glycosyltransferase involved in cell wall biosynthesis
MNKLSVVIITYNEEENLPRCLASVKTIADEIVVVDSFSTDNTEAVARKNGAIFLQHKFEGHIQQKNFAKEQAANNWVLSLDADEALSDELCNEILQWKLQPINNFSGYFMNRLNFYCGRPIKTCGWYPDRKLRLWKKEEGKWTGVNPHDKFELYEGKNFSFMSGDILHNTHPTEESLKKQTEKFGCIGAEHLKGQSVVYLIAKLLFSTPFRFIKSYFFQLGFTDGIAGFNICKYQAYEVFLKYYRAIQLKTNNSQQ